MIRQFLGTLVSRRHTAGSRSGDSWPTGGDAAGKAWANFRRLFQAVSGRPGGQGQARSAAAASIDGQAPFVISSRGVLHDQVAERPCRARHGGARVILPGCRTDFLGRGAHHHPAIARLFNGTAQIELREHFAEFAVLGGLVGTNAANLQGAINGESAEDTTLYPRFATQAVKDGCTAAAKLFTEVARDESIHAAAFTATLRSLSDPRVKVPPPPKLNPEAITATAPLFPGTRSQTNLSAAMRGEAFASARYLADAAQAARS